jgi:hypothetical protein
VEPHIQNILNHIEKCGKKFNDYSVIIYENDSSDKTREILNENMDLNIEIPEDSADPQMDKFFYIGQELKTHERYLIVDIDVLIRRDAPNIFDVVGGNRIGLYNEGGSLLNTYQQNKDDEIIRWTSIGQLIKLCELEPIEMNKEGSWQTPFFYFNSGVVVISKQNLNLYSGFSKHQEDLCYKFSKDFQCSEQAIVNYNAFKNKFTIVCLPVCFNQMTYNRCSDYLDTCYFSHYAGMPLEEKLKDFPIIDGCPTRESSFYKHLFKQNFISCKKL